MPPHVRLIALVLIGAGGALTFGAAVSVGLFRELSAALASSTGEDATGTANLLGWLGAVHGSLLLALAIGVAACGIGLWRGQRWARLGGIVAAAVSLLWMPLGTLFGVYALWVFFSDRAQRPHAGGDASGRSGPRPPSR